MPVKYQPDYIYLRHVQTARVHYFTIIQILCSAMMWIVKSIKATSIAFPLVVFSSPTFTAAVACIYFLAKIVIKITIFIWHL